MLATTFSACVGGDGGSRSAEPLRQRLRTSVVHVSVMLGDGGKPLEQQWIDVQGGRYRMQSRIQTWIYTGSAYEQDDGQGHVTIRIGSQRYLGDLAGLSSLQLLRPVLADPSLRRFRGAPLTQRIVRGRLQVSYGPWTVRILGSIRRSAPQVRRLFRIDPRAATTLSRELPVGTGPSFPVTGYWFGRSWQGRTAGTESEYTSRTPASDPAESNTQAFTVFYETTAAGTRSSAYAGSPKPAGEVQVVSLGRRSALAQRKLATTRGHPGIGTTVPWPRGRERLADGEPVIVIPFQYRTVGPGGKLPGFYVLTRTTLVSVNLGHGMRTALALAKDLRSLPASG
jgi:hypothetical protein